MDATTARPLQIGLFLPTWTSGEGLPAWTSAAYPDGPRWGGRARDRATSRSEAGFDSLWVCDHMLMDDDWEAPDDGVLGPPRRRIGDVGRVGAARGLAARRRADRARARWSHAPAYQNPARLARLADTIDEISGGRLILGLGAGDHWSEFLRFGVPDSTVLSPGSRRRSGSSCRCCATVASTSRASSTRRATASCLAAGSRVGPADPHRGARHGSADAPPGGEHADLWNGWYTFDDEPTAADAPGMLARIDEACARAGP